MKYILVILTVFALTSCEFDTRKALKTAGTDLVESREEIVENIAEKDWLGLGITVASALVSAVIAGFATKARKDGQIKQIVRGIETHKASLENGDVEKLHDALAEFQTKATEALIKKIRLKGK